MIKSKGYDKLILGQTSELFILKEIVLKRGVCMLSYDDIMLFFTIYSFLGWALESIFASINKREFVNRGFLNGFLCPIYGFGAILTVQFSSLLLHLLGNNLYMVCLNLFITVISVTILEYITGFLLETIFNCRWWDYSNNKINLKGYICLKFSLIWGLLTILLIKLIHPFVFKLVAAIPVSYKNIFTILLLLYFLIDLTNSVYDALDLCNFISNYTYNFPIKKIKKYKRFFNAFPGLIIYYSKIINKDIRSVLNDKVDKIKMEFKTRFL